MATLKYYLDTRREKKDGRFPVKIMMYHDKTYMVSTQFSASLKEWD